MLLAVEEMVPKILPIVHSSYASPSLLYWVDRTVISAEEVQGDPLGPLLFCQSIHHMTTRLASDFKIFYLEDWSLGGSCEDVLNDLKTVGAMALSSNLIRANPSLCAMIPLQQPDSWLLFQVFPLLPQNLQCFWVLESRISYLQVQDALLLLQHSLTTPSLLYLLRTTPCFWSPKLALFDETLFQIISSVYNNSFSTEDHLWTQASLPVKFGRLGIRSFIHHAPSAFLASLAGSSKLVYHIIWLDGVSCSTPESEAALLEWSKWHKYAPPTEPASFKQKSWDVSVVSGIAYSLLDKAPDNRALLIFVPVDVPSPEPG